MVLRFKSSTKGHQKSDPNDISNITIEGKHNSMMLYFKSLQKSLPEKRKHLKKLLKDYKEIKKLANEDKTNFDLILKKSDLREEIENLQKEILSIQNKEEERKYFLVAGSTLNKYFEEMENLKFDNQHDDTLFFGENNILNSSNHNTTEDSEEEQEEKDDEDASEEEEEESEEDEEENKKENETEEKKNVFEFLETLPKKKSKKYSSTKITDFIEKEKSKTNKKELLDEYLRKVDKNYTPKLKVDTTIYKCPECDIDMVLYSADGIQVCEKCGLEQAVLIESEKPSFKDPPLEAVFFSYKRINHFNELIAQFQAKESTEIPEEVFDVILGEIKKERIQNLESLTTEKIKKYLKKNSLTKYTDHVAHILYKINGIPPPQLSKDLEEKLRNMFKEIQGPFMEVCPNNRKNLLNYSYVFHKFFELLELDDFKKCFPLLKDREKLYHTEMVWKKICEKLGWKFIKSI